jgi:hypothetical protein
MNASGYSTAAMRTDWMVRTLACAATAPIGLSFAAVTQAQDEPAATASPQPAQEADEEIVIRGRRTLFTLRKETEAAREHVWEIFNEVNGNDDFDISCNTSARTGTRMTRRACRPQYANDATREAGRALARRIRLCDPTSDAYAGCLEMAMANGNAEAQQYIARIAYMDQRLDDEFRRLVRERPELTTAVHEFLSKESEYKEAAGLGSPTLSRDVSAALGELPYDAKLLFEVIMGEDPWRHPLTQRTFTIANVYGEIGDLALECAEGNERIDYVAGVDWTVPGNRSACLLQVTAKKGTTFRLYEF